MSSLFMGASKKKKKSIIIDGTHSPPLKWHREHFHSLHWITDDKGCIFVKYSYSNNKTQSHMTWRGLECNALKTKPSIKSLIKLMSSGAPALLLIFQHTWMGHGEMGRKEKHESFWIDCKIFILLKSILSEMNGRSVTAPSLEINSVHSQPENH